MHWTARIWVVTLVATALSGCATSAVTMKDSYTSTASAKRKPSTKASRNTKAVASLPASSCRIHFARLTDSRTDPTILGSVAGRPVLSPGEGSHWIGEMLRTGLAHQHIDVTLAPDNPAPSEALVADAELLTAWISSVTTSMRSNIVLTVSFPGADAAPVSKTYRGTGTAVNWASGEGEIQSLVNTAFGELLTKLAADIQARCMDS